MYYLKPAFAAPQKRLNLTKTVRKLPITEDLQRRGYYMHDQKEVPIKYDSEETQVRAPTLHAILLLIMLTRGAEVVMFCSAADLEAHATLKSLHATQIL
jgi:hypothetical protein